MVRYKRERILKNVFFLKIIYDAQLSCISVACSTLVLLISTAKYYSATIYRRLAKNVCIFVASKSLFCIKRAFANKHNLSESKRQNQKPSRTGCAWTDLADLPFLPVEVRYGTVSLQFDLTWEVCLHFTCCPALGQHVGRGQRTWGYGGHVRSGVLQEHLQLLGRLHLVVSPTKLGSVLERGITRAVDQLAVIRQTHGAVLAKISQPIGEFLWGYAQIRYGSRLSCTRKIWYQRSYLVELTALRP